MLERPKPTALGSGVTVQLLDSAQGHPLQTWRFANQPEITIGREEGNDVVLSDPHVSRLHVRITSDSQSWTLISAGRHGTLIDDRLVAEREMVGPTVFRLGPLGPTLRFEVGRPIATRTETIENIDPNAIAMLEVDEQRKQQEVDQIVGGELFETLRQEAERLKAARRGK